MAASSHLGGLSGGGLAGRQGRALEGQISSLLRAKGFTEIPHRTWNEGIEAMVGGEVLLRDVPYRTIYGHDGRTEFLLRSQRYSLNVRIECKWQQSSGSVDEKFPYLLLNCIYAIPEDQVIVVLDGGGAKPGAITWLRSAVQSEQYLPPERKDKRISVMTLAEFMVWANKTLR